VDCDKASRVARLLFHFGYEVAQSQEPPQWTPSGTEMLEQLSAGGN
jgi:hypothetical protein